MNNQESNTIQILDKSLKEGFSAMPRVVLRAKGLSRNAKCLYALLLDYAWQEGSCFPGQERLANDLNVTRQTIVKDLIELRDFGLISWVQRGLNKTNIYYIQNLGNLFFGQMVSVNPDVKNSVHPVVKKPLHQEVKDSLHIIDEEIIDPDKYKQPISNNDFGNLKINYLKQNTSETKDFSKQVLHLELLDKEAIALAEELNDKNVTYYQSIINKRNKGEITDNQIQSALNSVRQRLAVDRADGINFWKNPGAMFNKTLQQIVERAKSKQGELTRVTKKLAEEKILEPDKSIFTKQSEMNEARDRLLDQVRLIKDLDEVGLDEKEVNTS